MRYIPFKLSVYVVGCFLGVVCAELEAAAAKPLSLTIQRRAIDGSPHQEEFKLEPGKTALVVIDIWDKHWCETASARTAALARHINTAAKAARKLGIQMVFAPANCLDFYQNHPQRLAVEAFPKQGERRPNVSRLRFPVACNHCECTPDLAKHCSKARAWTRQHEAIVIEEGDLIVDCNDRRELLAICQKRGIETLLYSGIATNMCVLHRNVGMLAMKKEGFQVFLGADLSIAFTANGQCVQVANNAADKGKLKKDPNFTPAKGTILIQHEIEKQVAPTFMSRELRQAAKLGPRVEDPRPHIVFVIAEREYQTKRTLPAFAKEHLEKDYRCTFCFARSDRGNLRGDLPGLEAVRDADLVVLSMRRRHLPAAAMNALECYIRWGNPLIAIRTSVAPFDRLRNGSVPRGAVWWQDFDKEVLGCDYTGHFGKHANEIRIIAKASQHPILKNLPSAGYTSRSTLYRITPVANTVRPLLMGKSGDKQEVAVWTNEYAGGRVLGVALGGPSDFESDFFTQMLRHGVQWTLGK